MYSKASHTPNSIGFEHKMAEQGPFKGKGLFKLIITTDHIYNILHVTNEMLHLGSSAFPFIH